MPRYLLESHHQYTKHASAQPVRPLSADQWWIADFTYVHTSCGFSYVASVTDVFTREILAYVVDTRATKSLAIRALRQALALRQRQDPYFESAGVPHHSGGLTVHSHTSPPSACRPSDRRVHRHCRRRLRQRSDGVNDRAVQV
ncbi:DDE-type integrase/transposase/recombinase [Corynebacterium pseudogenitalium]|uniref:DDE-type integrase/transposase/recombinase n=1 Tax=Corynebacterium pseudogenitalium TaxID=38303 RepID=UPI003AF15884